MSTRGWIVWAVAASIAARAEAIDVGNGKLSVNGFGGEGFGKTGNANAYLLGNEDGNWQNAEFALQVTARPHDQVVVVGQIFVDPSGEASLDWAFAEYRVNDLLRIRAGKVKNPFGLFMEVKDVGTLRPFYTLPQSVYGPTDFSAEAYLGAGVTGEWQGKAGFGLAYDLYGGALEVPSFEPAMAIEAAGGVPPYAFANSPEHDALANNVIGGRIGLLTPLDGLTLRVSGFTGTFSQADAEDERIACLGVSGEWATDRLQVRGEWFRANEGEAEVHFGGYAEVVVNVLPKLQLAVRYEEAHQKGVDVASQFRNHREGAVGVGFWPSPNLVFKLSYHRVDGNRFAVPAASAPDGSVDARTDLVIAGAQFSF